MSEKRDRNALFRNDAPFSPKVGPTYCALAECDRGTRPTGLVPTTQPSAGNVYQPILGW